MSKRESLGSGLYRYTTKRGDTRFGFRVSGPAPYYRDIARQGFRSKRDAELAQTRERVRIQAMSASKPYVARSVARGVRLRDLWSDWDSMRRDDPAIAPSTRVQDQRKWRTILEPRLGDWPVTNIGTEAVRELRTWLLDTYSTRYAKNTITVLRHLLDVAVSRGLVDDNAARSVPVTTPKRETKRSSRHRYLEPDKIWAIARELEGQQRAAFLLLSICGLRWGELAALQVRDIDTVRSQLFIDASAAYLPDEDGDWGWVEGAPKTGASREVAVPSRLMPIILEQAEGKKRGDLLFTSSNGKQWRQPSKATGKKRKEWLEAALHRAGVEYLSVHQLRHTAASLLLAKPEVSLYAAARQLGHSVSVMETYYADLLDSQRGAVADALDSYLPESGMGTESPAN